MRPFRGVRYTERDVSNLICPPYDVISVEQRAELAAGDGHNAVAIELPAGDDDARYERAGDTFREWLGDGTLAAEAGPALYVHEHSFKLDEQSLRRLGVFAALRLPDPDTGAILPHERTLIHDRADRSQLIRAVRANTSPVWGIFDDRDTGWSALLRAATERDPDVIAGDEHRLWVVRDPESVTELARSLRAPLVVADGNHRYGVALRHRDMARGAAGEPQPAPDGTLPGTESVLMLLTGLTDPGLIVLPTHRLVPADAHSLDVKDFDSVRDSFSISASDPSPQPGAIVAVTPQGSVALRPRFDTDEALDVEILQARVLRPLLGIGPQEVEGGALRYERDHELAVAQVRSGGAAAAFLVNPVPLELLLSRSRARRLMPPKSTYFWPKIPTGLVFKDLDLAC